MKEQEEKGKDEFKKVRISPLEKHKRKKLETIHSPWNH